MIFESELARDAMGFGVEWSNENESGSRLAGKCLLDFDRVGERNSGRWFFFPFRLSRVTQMPFPFTVANAFFAYVVDQAHLNTHGGRQELGVRVGSRGCA